MEYLKGFAVSAVMFVFQHHFPLEWWELVLLGFGLTVIIYVR